MMVLLACLSVSAEARQKISVAIIATVSYIQVELGSGGSIISPGQKQKYTQERSCKEPLSGSIEVRIQKNEGANLGGSSII